MKKSRIIIPCVTAAVLLAAAAVVLTPRLWMQHYWKQYLAPAMPGCARGGEFSEYDCTDESLVPTKSNGYTVGVPADCGYSIDSEMIFLEDVEIYVSEDSRTIVELPMEPIAPAVRFEDIDLAAQFGTSLPFQGNTERGLRALGVGVPASDYAIHREAVLLDPEACPFWNLDAATAFCKLAVYKSIDTASVTEALVYETDTVKGIVYLTEGAYTDTGEPAYNAFFLFYAPDDLNTAHEFSITAPTREEVLAVVNSVTPG